MQTSSYNLDPIPDLPADFGPDIPTELGIEGYLRVGASPPLALRCACRWGLCV